MGEKIIVMSSMSSRNQSRPMAGPSPTDPLMGTLAPPSSAAPRANTMPVNARAFFRRSIADTTPRRIAPTISPSISMRMMGMG